MELKMVAGRSGRLSSFLLGELRLSSGLMNKLKWGNSLRVNGLPQRTNYPVQPGDEICVIMEEAPPEYPAEDGALAIVYEDDYLLAVDKPAGMLIHPSRSRFTGTLANYVAGYYRRTGQNSAFHPMTRLDRDTFGLVLLAKSAHIHALLQQTDSRKFYHALVYGHVAQDQGSICAPIARRELPSLLRYVDESGKPSVTNWRVLKRSAGYTLVELEAVTGRTHQLRLHCAYMGHPILGDPQYGSEGSQTFSQAKAIPYQLLCAKRLELTHPMTGERLILESDMDAALQGMDN